MPHSDRPPSTLSSAPSQPTLEALAALLKIEIKFAALRDQLYIERMNEITKEEEMVVKGTSVSPQPFLPNPDSNAVYRNS